MSASRTFQAVALVPPPTARRIESARGSIAVWEVRPTVYASEVHGYLTRDMAQLIMDVAEPLYGDGPKLRGFHNWFDMENYESACRVDLTAWVLRHRGQSTLHIGLTSRLVAMGVAVANLALGSLIEIHSEPSSLDSAFRTALQATS